MKRLLTLSLVCATAIAASACNDTPTPKPCITRCDGDVAINCIKDANGEEAGFQETTCDPGLCKYKYEENNPTAFCLEKCPSDKEKEFSCNADGNVTFTGCPQTAAGGWYLSSTQEYETCLHGCENGECIKLAPEEGLPCDESTSIPQCKGNLVLSCVEGRVAVAECPDSTICVNRIGQIVCRPSCDVDSSSYLCIDDDHAQAITCTPDANQNLYYEDVIINCLEGCDRKISQCKSNLVMDGTICNPEKVGSSCANDVLTTCDPNSGYYTSRNCAKYDQRCVTFEKGETKESLCAEFCETVDATRQICDGDNSVTQICIGDDKGTKIWKTTASSPCEHGCHSVTGECKGPSGCKETDPSSCNGDTRHGCLYDEKTETWQNSAYNCLIDQNLCYSGITTGYCLPMPSLDPTPENQPSEKGASCNPKKFVEHCEDNTLVYCYRGKDDPGYVVYRTDCSEENETCGITRFFDEDNPEGVNQGQCLNNINLCDDPYNPVTIECFGKTAYAVKCQTYTDKKLHTVAQRAKQTCKNACVNGVGCVDEEAE